jgi:hypothetical protein
MGGCSSKSSTITEIEFDIKFSRQNSDSMLIHISLVSGGSYDHYIYYEGSQLKIFSSHDGKETLINNNCVELENLFKSLQKLADSSGIYDKSLKSSHAFESIKNNILYTNKMFGELPIDFLGKYLLFTN